MKTAYSYVRFSSAEQSKGDSLRRQSELSREYAAKHGFALDESLKPDKGVSAFRGKNRTEGNLAAFLAKVKDGTVTRGSVLLVESLDRLSREEVEEALYSFLDIIRTGVEIHTLSDGQIYRKGELKTEQLMLSLFVMSRANEESERKSQRVGSAWRQKKANAAQNLGVAITAKVPAWIRATKGEPMQLIPERAEVVRRIFEMSLSGLGANLIAQHLNKEHSKLATTDKGWHKSYVEKILVNPATYGAYIPQKRNGSRREIDGEPIQGFFPAAIDYSLFLRVQEARAARYRKRKGSTSATINNLFAGLVRDATLNLPMVFYWRGKELVTDSYRVGVKPNRIPYERFEKSFLKFLEELDVQSILGTSDSEELQKAEKTVSDISAKISLSQDRIEKLAGLLLDTPSQTLKVKLVEEEQALANAKANLVSATETANAVRATHRDLLDNSIVYSELANATDLVTRAKLREEIRRKVAGIEIHFGTKGTKSFRAVIEFVNGARKQITAHQITKGPLIHFLFRG